MEAAWAEIYWDDAVWLTIKRCAGHLLRKFWRLNSAFYSPRQFGPAEPATQYFLAYSRESCEVRKCEPSIFVQKTEISDEIVRLFSACSPSAIIRFVVAIVVDTFNCVVAFWSNAHISEKVSKQTPSFAHSYAAFLVISKSWIRSVRAARNHVAPRAIGGRHNTARAVKVTSLVPVDIHGVPRLYYSKGIIP